MPIDRITAFFRLAAMVVALRQRVLASAALAMFVAISACSPFSRQTAIDDGQAVSFAGPDFTFNGRAYPASSSRLWVVIEGDGANWVGGKPPRDPTPRHPMGPGIVAALPQRDARLYLARPCQFLDQAGLSACAQRYWTDDRFAPEVVAAFDRAISRFAANGQSVVLVGFSGGGVLAAELALTRTDVAGLVTFAAPLDLDSWTDAQKLPRLSSPTPPEDLLRALAKKTYPRAFVFGGKDDVVPPRMLDRIERLLPPETVRIEAGFDHNARWETLLTPAAVLASFP